MDVLKQTAEHWHTWRCINDEDARIIFSMTHIRRRVPRWKRVFLLGQRINATNLNSMRMFLLPPSQESSFSDRRKSFTLFIHDCTMTSTQRTNLWVGGWRCVVTDSFNYHISVLFLHRDTTIITPTGFT